MPFRPGFASWCARFQFALVVLVALSAARVVCAEEAAGEAKKPFAVGDAVSVREGDTWSSAKITQREGRKFQIQYDDGTEEWVTSDRLRDAGAAKDEPDADVPKATGKSRKKAEAVDDDDSDQPATKRRPARKYKASDAVEIYWGASWYPGRIKMVKGNQYFVAYDGWSETFDEWVPVTNLRRPGEQGEVPDPFASIDRTRANGVPQPKRDPFRREEPDDPSRPLSVAKTDDAKDLQFIVGADAKFTPDPAENPLKLSPRSIVLQGATGSRWAGIEGVRFADKAGYVVFKERGGRNQPAVVERVDLQSGKSTNVWPLLKETNFASASSDGKRAVIQSDRFFSNTKGRVDVYLLENKEPAYIVGFLPYSDQQHRDVTWARMIDEQHLLTLGGRMWESQLVLWEVSGCNAKWTTKVPFQSEPAVSPGGKQLAFALSRNVVVIEALSGDALVNVPNPYGSGKAGFSPDGTKLAVAGGGVVVLFDLVKGEMLASIASSGAMTTPAWTDDDHLLVGDLLFSASKRCALWAYKSPSQLLPLQVVGGVTWFASDSNGPRLAGLPLPSPEALRAEKSIDEGSHFLLRPGAKISLDVQAGTETAKVVETYTNQLASAGITVAPGQPVILRATAVQGPAREVEYEVRKFGAGFDTEKVKKNVTETIYTVSIVGKDNQPGWKYTANSGTPDFVWTRGDEKIDDALKREQQVNASWFSSVKIPTHVPHPRLARGFGESTLTPQGLQEAQSSK